MKQALDAVLDDAVRSGAIPGVVAVVTDRDSDIFVGAAGERNVGSGTAMTADTVGVIFSMTKAITGVAAMQLVERGQIDLDGDAGAICPSLRDPVVLEGFDADGEPITRAASGPITLRHLLTHTAGFAYDIWNGQMAQWYKVTGTPSQPSLRQALQTPLLFDPGTDWQYGISLDWVGLLIEKVSGGTLGEYMSENILEPLMMHDTTFAPSNDQVARMSAMHARLPDGSLVATHLPRDEAAEFESGGGGLVSTMVDYARFIRMILNDGELDGTRILQPATVQTMAENHMGDLRVQQLISHAPAFSNDAELFPGEQKSWGLSFQVHEQPSATGAPAGTLTWAGLSNCYFWIDRENGIGGCYLAQILPFADEPTLTAFYDVMRTVYANR